MSKSNQNTSALTSAIDDIRHKLIENLGSEKKSRATLKHQNKALKASMVLNQITEQDIDIDIDSGLEQEL